MALTPEYYGQLFDGMSDQRCVSRTVRQLRRSPGMHGIDR
jgi:hypothetical protein